MNHFKPYHFGNHLYIFQCNIIKNQHQFIIIIMINYYYYYHFWNKLHVWHREQLKTGSEAKKPIANDSHCTEFRHYLILALPYAVVRLQGCIQGCEDHQTKKQVNLQTLVSKFGLVIDTYWYIQPSLHYEVFWKFSASAGQLFMHPINGFHQQSCFAWAVFGNVGLQDHITFQHLGWHWGCQNWK